MLQNEKTETTREGETIAEVTEKWKRALADYQNLLKRSEEEKKQLAHLVKGLTLLNLLPVVDSLEQALAQSKDEGYKLIHNQFLSILESQGVVGFGEVGEEFDPEKYEAVEVRIGDEDNKVIKVERRGYTLNEKTLRAAQVIVSKKESQEEDK